MTNLFKTLWVPNPDGTNSTTAITNANTAFVHTYLGDDLTGDGTREYPFKSAFKANQKSGVAYIVFRGVINEAFSTGKQIIGDDLNQYIITENYAISTNGVFRTSFDSIRVGVSNHTFKACLVNKISTFENYAIIHNCFIKKIIGAFQTRNRITKSTLSCLITSYSDWGTDYEILNNIFLDEFSVPNATPVKIKHCIFSSSVIFKLDNVVVQSPEWTNNSSANLSLLRDAYVDAGMNRLNADLLFYKDSFNNETCKIIWEEKDGGTHPNIFNRYNPDGSVADYSLNPNLYNEALYASDLGGYVGCFKPANPITTEQWLPAINVNADGTDSATAGTLIHTNVDGTIDFNTASSQIWNRLRSTQTIMIPNGIKFNAASAMSDDGSAFGYYFGKHQNLMNPTAILEGTALEANTIYKVCNPLRSVYQAILYNDNQYLPDYFLRTDSNPLSFSLLNADSGTVLKKVLATPLESIEVIPYDDMTTPSVTFPKFSSPLMGDVSMLYHKIGVNIDKPVLFSEIANDKIAYYQDWAVTNADQEFCTLSLDTVNYYYKLPTLKYLRLSLNAHFNADYDQ